MKKKLINYMRIIVLIALAILAVWGLVALNVLHRSTCPELYVPGSSDYVWLYLTMFVLVCMLIPVFTCICGLMTGYRLHRMRILFIDITQDEKLHIRLSKRIGLGASMLPPRTDGTSPHVLPLLSLPLSLMILAALCLALAGIFWHTGPAQALLIVPAGCLGLIVVTLLPRRNGTDYVSLLLAFRNRDLLRAWECTMCITTALGDGRNLADMPDEWFQTYPAELAENVYVSNCIINGSSRLIRQGRFNEAYEMLRPLFDLKPSPESHQRIACSILNGAICEAMEGLPPLCLNQLEHPSLKYMMPPNWQPRLLTAQYARALFVHHDENEAAAILPELEKIIEKEGKGHETLERLQKKAGIGGSDA